MDPIIKETPVRADRESIAMATRVVRWAETSPHVLDMARAEAVESEFDQSAGLHDVTVMMVDDEPLMTDVVQTYLEDAGYRRFVSINNPLLALEGARRHRPGLLLLDLMMPGLSGFEILALVRSDPVLRYTPDGADIDFVRCFPQRYRPALN